MSSDFDCSGVVGESGLLGYRIGGLFGILSFSVVGFVLPYCFAGRLDALFYAFQTFASGVVIAVAIVHILPDAISALSNPCLGLSDYPWAATIVLLSLILTFIFEKGLHAYFSYYCRKIIEIEVEDEEMRTAAIEKSTKSAQILDYKAVAYTLEMGIIFHSFFVGILLGTSNDPALVKGLTFALVFHQGFEGIALGGAMVRAEIKLLKFIIYGLAFSLTTPIGIAIGLGISNSYNPNSKSYLMSAGILNSMASGILLHNGVVDLMVPAFTNQTGFAGTTAGSFVGYSCLLLGAGAMALIAHWA